MKEDKLLKAMSDINDEFILEAGGCQNEKTKKRKRKPIAILALAAVLLITMTVSVFAEETPGDSLLARLREVSWNKAEQSAAVDGFATQNNADGALKIEESYYDGEALVLGVSLELENNKKDIDQLVASFYVKYYQDGKEVKSSKAYTDPDIGMFPDGNGRYIGSVMVYPDTDEAELGLPDNFTVELSERYVYGYDYENPDKNIKIKQKFAPASCEVKIDSSQVNEYTVEETSSGCVLHSVTVTPAWTDVNVELLEGESEYAIVEGFGSDGEKLESLELYGSGHRNSGVSRMLQTPDKDETELRIVVYTNKDTYSKGEVLAEFTVPVGGGYDMSAYEDVPEVQDDGAEMEVSESLDTEDYEYSGAILTNQRLEGSWGLFPEGTESGIMDIAFSNIRYFDSPADAGISADELSELYDPADEENCTFVLMDLMIESVDDISEVVENGKNVYFIEKFANAAVSVDPYYGHGDETAYLAYFSAHGEEYGKFAIGQMEVINVQLGYMIDTEELNKGNAWVYSSHKELAKVYDEDGNEYIRNGASYHKIPPMA